MRIGMIGKNTCTLSEKNRHLDMIQRQLIEKVSKLEKDSTKAEERLERGYKEFIESVIKEIDWIDRYKECTHEKTEIETLFEVFDGKQLHIEICKTCGKHLNLFKSKEDALKREQEKIEKELSELKKENKK